jgi:hypothetical protein
MRIISRDARCSIDVTRHDDGAYSSFAVSCAVDIGHGRFNGANEDVHFLNLREFVGHLDAFILDRTVTPTLSGTYESSIRLWSPADHRLVVMLDFAIGDAYAGTPFPVKYRMEGQFEIDQDMLNSILQGFRELGDAA